MLQERKKKGIKSLRVLSPPLWMVLTSLPHDLQPSADPGADAVLHLAQSRRAAGSRLGFGAMQRASADHGHARRAVLRRKPGDRLQVVIPGEEHDEISVTPRTRPRVFSPSRFTHFFLPYVLFACCGPASLS